MVEPTLVRGDIAKGLAKNHGLFREEKSLAKCIYVVTFENGEGFVLGPCGRTVAPRISETREDFGEPLGLDPWVIAHEPFLGFH